MVHPTHKKELSRLNRILGQIEGVKGMIEERRYCPDILIQLKAIRSAVKSLEASILRTHLEKCVTEALTSQPALKRKKIDELVKLFYRYE